MSQQTSQTAQQPIECAYNPQSFSLSAAEYQLLIERSPVMIWRSGIDAGYSYVNETWLAFTGRTMEQESDDGWAVGIHPEDAEQCMERYLDAFQKRNTFEIEYRLRRHDGVYRRISDRGAPLFDERHEFMGYVGSCVDIEDHWQARVEREEHHQETLKLYEELRMRDARFHRLIDASIIGVVFADVSGAIVEANDAFLSMVGYGREDLRAGLVTRKVLTPPESMPATEAALLKLRATGSTGTFEKEYRRKDGSRLPVLVAATSFGDEHSELVAFVLDLTEARRAEQQRERLRQAEADLAYMNRVLTLGELSAITHDIKQPITAALASIEACSHLLGQPDPDRELVREIVTEVSTEVRRASNIIDRIRSLYAREAPCRDAVDVNELVRDMVVLLDREAKTRGVSIRTELTPMMPPVSGDRVQLQQVLLNLMLNGIEASAEAPGELVIQTRRDTQRGVVVAVSDSGVGLPAGHADRIFDAFFTTKPHGTGMGLAISRAIVQAHGGTLWAVANPTAGATFQFTLPN